MIVPPTGIRVLVATKPVDFRKGMDGLAAYVQEHLQADPFSGVVYVFRSKRADRVKLLFWDQTGVVLVTKRSSRLAIVLTEFTTAALTVLVAALGNERLSGSELVAQFGQVGDVGGEVPA